MTTDYTQWRSMVDEQAYPAISDSALLHYPLIERDNDIIVEEIEGADGTADGTNNVSNNWWRGYAEENTGTDTVNLGTWEEVDFGEKLIGDWGLAYTIETTDDSGNWLGTRDDDGWGFRPAVYSQTADGDAPADKIALFMRDRGGSDNTQVIHSDSDINDGNKHRIIVGGDGPSADDKVLFFDGENETNISNDGEDHSFEGNLGIDLTAFARNRDGGPDQRATGIIDNIILLDQKPTESLAQDDLDSQPWT